MRTRIGNVELIIPEVKLTTSKLDTNIASACTRCSFEYVADLLHTYLDKYYNVKTTRINRLLIGINIVITDLYTALETFAFPPKTILWIDTAWTNAPVQPTFKNAIYIVTSKWNAELLRKYGIDAYIIPRGINDDMLPTEISQDRNIEFTFIGANSMFKRENLQKYNIDYDRKGIYETHNTLVELGVRKDSILICDEPVCDKEPWSVPEHEKWKILQHTKYMLWLSRSEGFGLPPVEANACGVPVAYLDMYTTREHLQNMYNFPIPVNKIKKLYVNFVQREFPQPVYDHKDVVSVVKKMMNTEINRIALANYTRSKYTHKVILQQFMNIYNKVSKDDI